MRILFCDTASNKGMIACATDDKVAALDSIDHRIDDAGLISLIETILVSAKWTYHDLTHIACVIGPGGFTSLRTAVTLANAMSHELDIPVCGMHLSDLYYARIPSHPVPLPSAHHHKPPPLGPLPPPSFAKASEGKAGERGRYVWLHSTKKHELFIREYALSEPRCITLDQLRPMLKKGMQWTGELISEHRVIVAGTGAEEIKLETKEDILPIFLKTQSYKKQILQPWYGREW